LSKEIGVPIIAVSYSDVDSLVIVLETNKVDTVISTVSIASEDASVAQLNLIEAAARASTTKRFIPSDFGIIYNER
jgi:major membrane immunogen (membrane-anchored lipoprotein)